KTQSNLEVSQSIRLFFNYLGMTQLMSGGGIIIVAQTVIPQLSTLFS
ncbi:MAG: Maff2 family protein, partial [Lachnospiraceae bacterium]|nr:Maff2 family protein [Lachnospiraceae bacterium]